MNDEFDDDDQLDADLAAMVDAGVRSTELARFGRLEPDEQRQLRRRVRRAYRKTRRRGVSDQHAVVAMVTNEVAHDPAMGSILAVLLIAALAATVRFWVTRWWERHFPSEAGS